MAVRVNPDFEFQTSSIKIAGAKLFGIDDERVPDLLRRLDALKLDFAGFHVFNGSQNLRAETIQEAQEKTIQLALELAEHAPAPLRLLNIGGRFGIPYVSGDKPLDLAAVGHNLERLPRVNKHLPQTQIVIELGRYLVGEAGVYVCRVIDRKVSRG